MLQQVHACGPLLSARPLFTHLAAASGREASGVGAWQWEAPNHGLHPPPTASRAAAEAAPTSAWYWKVSASVVAAAAQMARRCWRAASLRSRRAAAAAARVAPAAAAAGRPVSARRGAAAVLVAWRAAPACERGGRLAREVQGRRRARSLAHHNLTHAMHIISGSSQRPQLTATAERAVGVARHCTILLSIHGAPSKLVSSCNSARRPQAGGHVHCREAATRKRTVRGWLWLAPALQPGCSPQGPSATIWHPLWSLRLMCEVQAVTAWAQWASRCAAQLCYNPGAPPAAAQRHLLFYASPEPCGRFTWHLPGITQTVQGMPGGCYQT